MAGCSESGLPNAFTSVRNRSETHGVGLELRTRYHTDRQKAPGLTAERAVCEVAKVLNPSPGISQLHMTLKITTWTAREIRTKKSPLKRHAGATRRRLRTRSSPCYRNAPRPTGKRSDAMPYNKLFIKSAEACHPAAAQASASRAW